MSQAVVIALFDSSSTSRSTPPSILLYSNREKITRASRSLAPALYNVAHNDTGWTSRMCSHTNLHSPLARPSLYVSLTSSCSRSHGKPVACPWPPVTAAPRVTADSHGWLLDGAGSPHPLLSSRAVGAACARICRRFCRSTTR